VTEVFKVPESSLEVISSHPKESQHLMFKYAFRVTCDLYKEYDFAKTMI